MSDPINLETSAERVPSPEKPAIVTKVETSLAAIYVWNQAEKERVEKLTTAKKLDEADNIAKYSQPAEKNDEARKGDNLLTIISDTYKLCDEPFEGSAERMAAGKAALEARITELISSKDEALTPEKFVQITTIIRKQGSNPRSQESAGNLVEAYPQTIHSQAFQAVTEKIVSDTSSGILELKTYAPKKDNPRNIDKLLIAATTPESPLNPETKRQLEDVSAAIAGYRLRNFADVSAETSSSGSALLAQDIHERIKGIVDVDLNQLDSVLGKFTGANQLGEKFAQLARLSTDELQKRRLRLLALGYAEATLDLKPVFNSSGPSESAETKNRRIRLHESAAKVVSQITEPDVSILVDRRRTDGTPAEKFLRAQVNRLIEKGPFGNSGDPVELQHRDVLAQQDAAKQAEQQKKAERQEKAAAEAQRQQELAVEAQLLARQNAQPEAAPIVQTPNVETPIKKKKRFGLF